MNKFVYNTDPWQQNKVEGKFEYGVSGYVYAAMNMLSNGRAIKFGHTTIPLYLYAEKKRNEPMPHRRYDPLFLWHRRTSDTLLSMDRIFRYLNKYYCRSGNEWFYIPMDYFNFTVLDRFVAR